ncbi:MAG: FMN-binding protein [Clostridia bacterium]|nr:FMN-binding protein [Clostridia bacterium]
MSKTKKMNTSVKSIIVLVAICLFIAVAMAAVNMVTAPRIEEQQRKAEQEALAAVVPDNGGFEKIENIDLPESVSAVYRDKDGEGLVAMLTVKGYDSSKPMSVAVGYKNDGSITKMVIISASGETSGIGSKVTLPDFTSQFEGKTETLEGVDAISGATVSSGAVIDAVKESFTAINSAVNSVKEAQGNE